jgi:hypothetical protein
VDIGRFIKKNSPWNDLVRISSFDILLPFRCNEMTPTQPVSKERLSDLKVTAFQVMD